MDADLWLLHLPNPSGLAYEHSCTGLQLLELKQKHGDSHSQDGDLLQKDKGGEPQASTTEDREVGSFEIYT